CVCAHGESGVAVRAGVAVSGVDGGGVAPPSPRGGLPRAAGVESARRWRISAVMSQSGTDGAQPPRDGGGTQRIKEVFDEAADLPRGERAAFLDSACNGDAGVRAQVESLLRAMDESRDFLARVELPRAERASVAAVGEGPGDVIGRYELVELIGEGGFGSVFLAGPRGPGRS